MMSPVHAIASSHDDMSIDGKLSCSSTTSNLRSMAIALYSVGGAETAAPTTQKKMSDEAMTISTLSASSPRLLA